jgi:hypothetical protein
LRKQKSRRWKQILLYSRIFGKMNWKTRRSRRKSVISRKRSRLDL